MKEEYNSLLGNDTWDLLPLSKGIKFVKCNLVYITKYGPNGKVDKHKAILFVIFFHKLRALTIPRPFPLLQKWTPFILFYPFLHPINGKSIKWMSNIPSCKDSCMKKSTWNNLLVLSKMTLALFSSLRNLFMVLIKPLVLGIPKWIYLFWIMAFLDVIPITMSIPKESMVT